MGVRAPLRQSSDVTGLVTSPASLARVSRTSIEAILGAAYSAPGYTVVDVAANFLDSNVKRQ